MRNAAIGFFAERVAKGDDSHPIVKSLQKLPASGGFLQETGLAEMYCA
jgi:hypothetical protein